jgi:hypothetical protein
MQNFEMHRYQNDGVSICVHTIDFLVCKLVILARVGRRSPFIKNTLRSILCEDPPKEDLVNLIWRTTNGAQHRSTGISKTLP